MRFWETWRFGRWLPALTMMLAIWMFSSLPSRALPDFNWADLLVKKGGHMTGYALLAWSYCHALQDRPRGKRRCWLALGLVFLYALSDEWHQGFVPGRHASGWDVLIDTTGGGLFLWWYVRHGAGWQQDKSG